MAQVESDLALHPSPVLLEAVLKVEQVVARLQNLQSTISGIHLSPVNAKLTRLSRANATSRAKDSVAGKENTRLSQLRDEDSKVSVKYHNADSKPVQRVTPRKSKGEWKQWSSPANQVHDVISEILMASEYAKQIATLVAEALHDGPVKTKEPVARVPELKKRVSKDGKRKDIAFPSKAQVQRTMSGKLQPSKSVNKFKVVFPSDITAKPPKLTRTLSPRLGARSPERKRASQKLFTSPNGSFRESDYADDELSGPRRLSMNVTEIKGSSKPWKLTPTKGVLFSNPVYMATPSMAVRPSPVKIVPGKNESMRKRSVAAPANSVSSSLSKVTFKREGSTKAAAPNPQREQKARKVSRYVEMVPVDVPQNSSSVTMLDVLKGKSPRRRRLQPLDANNERSIVGTEKTKETVQEEQCRVAHSHSKPTPIVEVGHTKSGKPGGPADSDSDKENAPVPRCAPSAVKELFLRSMSSGNALNRTLSHRNSVSLLQRAKGWMSSQAVKQGRVRELER